MNKKRQAIWDKSNGKCWYCGCDLPVKGWHADHLEPVFRYQSEMSIPGRDNLTNLVPACAPCNLFKSTFSLEGFRREVSFQADRAREYSTNFRTAERFGLVTQNKIPVVFWFEDNRQGL